MFRPEVYPTHGAFQYSYSGPDITDMIDWALKPGR